MNNLQVISAFGKHLKRLRKARGLSQLDLALDANVARSTIQRVEGAEIAPTLDLLYSLSVALDMPLKELLDFEIPANHP